MNLRNLEKSSSRSIQIVTNWSICLFTGPLFTTFQKNFINFLSQISFYLFLLSVVDM